MRTTKTKNGETLLDAVASFSEKLVDAELVEEFGKNIVKVFKKENIPFDKTHVRAFFEGSGYLFHMESKDATGIAMAIVALFIKKNNL